jgi:hypothetical protein
MSRSMPDSATEEVIRVDDQLSQLEKVVDNLRADPSFLHATQLCVKTRLAWNEVYDFYLFCGREAGLPPALRFQAVINQGIKAVEPVKPEKSETSQFDFYLDTIKFRAELVQALIDKGADAVHRLLQERLAIQRNSA